MCWDATLTRAPVERDDNTDLHRFALVCGQHEVFSSFYRDRHGLGTLPMSTSRLR
ncbi:hypothetical protein AAW51_5132 [Caldimonas brevitalea]|uniref:Uncharacterized protein n=1 Tax=Caldimonas brevitalea TaxID=413882 RepID=A0A0G3BV05_9BURK|nr:hypothetical protein AAW51_5132 [Caldimonas brevitalea]